MRRAFTLIETLVALVILEFAMLAVAAATTVAARNFVTAHRAVRAQALARNRLESLSARACVGPLVGSRVVTGGYDERWEIEGSAPLRRVSVLVEYEATANRRTQVTLASSVWCPE
jgi:type II secretory pathway pseudopilin PulG